MSVYSYNTQGIFPSIIRAASEGLGSFSYVYEPSIIDRYNELDYGSLEFNSTPVTETETVAVDNLNATLTNTFLTDSGTGTGTTGGFNIGRHIRFNSTNKPRTVEFSLPNNINSSLTFEVIRGNDNNGGEDPDTVAESLNLEYYDGSSWISIDAVVAHNDTTFDTLKSVEITIPVVARTAGTQFRLIQLDHSGNNWDHYGLKSVTYTHTTTPVLPTINFGNISDINATLEDYGRVVYVTNVESFGFVKVVSESSWKATNTYEGIGIAFTFGKQTAPAVYGYIVDGKVKGLSLGGASTEVFSPKHDGVGSTSVLGQSPIGIGVGVFGSGTLFTIASTDDAFVSTWTSSGYISKVTGAARDITLVHETGFGDLFTLSNGQQRATNAFVGSGGLKLVSRKPELPELSDEKHTEKYINDSIIEFSKEDYGYLTICHPNDIEDVSGTLSGTSSGCIVRVGSTASIDPGTTYGISLGANAPSNFIDYGLISESAAPQVDFGKILTTGNLIPFGLFHLDPENGAQFAFNPTWTSRGYISKLTGEASVPLDVSVFGTGTIRKLGGDSITNFALLQPGDGLFGFRSDTEIGITAGITGTGFIPTLNGAADSVTFNPEEKDLLFSLIGEATFSFNPNWVGSGVLFTLQTAVEKTVYDYIGSGRIFGFNNLEEKKVYDYNCSSIVAFPESDYGFIINTGAITCIDVDGVISTNETTTSGCIKVLNTLTIDPGVTYSVRPQSTIVTGFLDYGLTSENAAPLADFGDILGTPRLGLPGCIYGHIDITGESVNNFAPNWISRGYISKLIGEARVPLDVTVFGTGTIRKLGGDSITNFSLLQPGDGLFGFHSESQIGIGVGIFGDGFIPTLSGAADSVTFNPDEKDLLFSLTGEATFTHNLNWIGSGVLFTLQTAVERTVYDYVGSGGLFGFNNLEEVKVYSYNCSSIVPFPENDYGFIINTGAIACVNVDGVISASETTTSGCIKVLNSLTIDSGVTYSIRPQSTIVSSVLDYGLTSENAAPLADFGHILDTPRLGMPGCIYGHIDITGASVNSLAPNWISQGVIKLSGEGRVPLDVAVFGTGTIRKLGGDSITNFSLLQPGDGLFGFRSDTEIGIGVGIFGDGFIPTLSGAADSVTFNPEEKDLLFSFTGEATFAFNPNWVGSGVLFTLQTAIERTVYDYVGSGGLFGFNNLEEVKVYSYNCSSVAPYTEPDYGFIIDPNAVSCVDVDGVISTDTTSTTGCTKVLNSLTVDPGVTYTITPQYTVPSSTLDYGFVAENASPLVDHGHILGTPRQGLPACIYGEIDIFGVADIKFTPNYIGRGFIYLDGVAISPLFARNLGSGEIKLSGNSKTNFSPSQPGDGLFGFRSDTEIGITVGITGTGTLFGYTGTAESLSTIPPTEQPIFTFVGTSGDPGILLAHEGSGSLFAVSGGDLRVQYAYETTGSITLCSKKPELSELSEEKHTEVYSMDLCRDEPELDYGRIVDLSANSVCVDVDGVVSTNTTSSSGCTKVTLGSTLSIDPGVTYTLTAFTTVPTVFADYQDVSDTEDGLTDYGHILDTTGLVCPFGQLDSLKGTLVEKYIRNTSIFTESTVIKIGGDAFIVVPPQWNNISPPILVRNAAIPLFSLRTFGGGSLFGFGGATESRRYSPDEVQLLFKVSPGPFSRFVTYDWQPSWVSQGTIPVSGIAETPRARAFAGFGSLFGINGAAEAVSFNPPDITTDIKLSGVLAESFTIPYTGTGSLFTVNNLVERVLVHHFVFGTINVSGVAATPRARDFIGSGAIFSNGVTSESITKRLPAFTAHIKFGGTSEEVFSANPPEEGTEIRLSGDTTPQILTFAEQPFGVIPVSGIAKTHYVPSVVGTGTFRKFSGASESLTVNPEEKQMLFSFIGEGKETHTENYVGVEKAIRIRRGALSDFETFDWQPSWVVTGTIPVSGEAKTNFSLLHNGSGSLKTLSGSAESLTVNPEERQMLFSFTGTRIAEITSIAEFSTGSLFGIGGLSESFTASPELQADLRISGDVFVRYVPNNIGSGNIFAINGAAESITFNPDERQMLFSFIGEASESFSATEIRQIEVDITGEGQENLTSVYTGSGSAQISGVVTEKFVPNNIGFGNIFALAGSAESITFNPDEKQMLFSFTGEGTERILVREISQGGTFTFSGTSGDPLLTFAEQPFVQTKISGKVFFTTHRSIVGTGSLFGFGGVSESTGVVPQTEQVLFKVSGDSINKISVLHIGSGSLRKLSGSAESVTFNPDERQMLFSFIGAGTENTTAREVSQGGLFKASGEAGVLVRFAHTGEGTIPLSGNATTTRARDFVGFGIIPTLSGAAESLTVNPDEKQMLFSFAGERISEKITAKELGTPGKFTLQGTSGDPLLTFSEQPFVKINVNGVSTSIRSRAYAGSGTLFGFINGDEAFARAPYIASGSIAISGFGIVQVELFQPPRTYVWMI